MTNSTITSRLKDIEIRHQLVLMQFPELIELNKEFLKRQQEYKDSFKPSLSQPSPFVNHAKSNDSPKKDRIEARVQSSLRSMSPTRSVSPHRHINKSVDALSPPNKFYNVRLANHPIFLRRTSIKPSHFDNVPRKSLPEQSQYRGEKVVKVISPIKRKTANANLQTIEEIRSSEQTASDGKQEIQNYDYKKAANFPIIVEKSVAVTQTEDMKYAKTEILQTSPPQSDTSSDKSNQTFKNLAQRHLVDWMVQQAFIKAMGNSEDPTISQISSSFSSSSDSLFENYAQGILKRALKEIIVDQLGVVKANVPEKVENVLSTPAEIESFTMASTDISQYKKSSSSSSKSKKVSFLADAKTYEKETLKTPMSDISIDPVPNSVGDQLDSPAISARNLASITDLSMTETTGEIIPIGSVGEYLELPSFSQMLSNVNISLDSHDENPPTFSSADLNFTSSEAVSVGQILNSSSRESGEKNTSNSEGEIKIARKKFTSLPSSFGSESS
eukprot:NODE_102_length_19640_cov_1.308735.p7 type:complete len:500 gc:universal NODE_102_length_19640_cov_1.308735:3418-4917(+)